MSSTGPISPAHRKGKRKIETAPPSDVVVNSDGPLAGPKENKKKRKRVQSNAITIGTGEETEAREVAGEGSLHAPSSHPGSEAEIEVLSHAALRKRKKAKIASDPSPPILSNKDSENTPKSSSAPQRQNSTWVGNLTFKTTTQQLREFFQFAGDITRIHMPTKAVAKGNDKDKRFQNRGFAYVDFATPQGKAEAITYSERNLDGRKLLIKDGDDFTGRPIPDVAPSIAAVASSSGTPSLSKFAQKVLRAQRQPAGPTLFMGNLGFEATAESVREMIEAHERTRDAKTKAKKKGSDGEDTTKDGIEENTKESPKSLKKVRMGTFEDSGLCKGFAFLDFITPQHATMALIDPRNYSLDGRTLKLEFASADAVRRGGNLIQSKNGAVSGHVDSKSGRGPRRSESDTMADPSSTRRKLGGRGLSRIDAKNARQRPGAVLASAQREQAGIVPSSGKKIVF
ncbi:hypothetical protein BS47DRAFT_1488500 [Hydnum rufescens UP504]|uniref:RRM domain-containing protein n=1 Tax=Hydnum rufescens UP504 TaxID=1448309 RepID=A0A9P6DMN4_9AGAM|nr:hypothetical protein BS47DRAFT_1488500 [Hydnum rufescens UP504]